MITRVFDSTALLTYSLMTSPSPPAVSPASGPSSPTTLTFAVSAAVSIGTVTVRSLVFNLPVGDPLAPDPSDLTDDAGSISASVASSGPDQWQVGPGAAPGSFIVRPKDGQPTVVGPQSLTITFTVVINPIVGTAAIAIVEDSTAPAQPRRLTMAVAKFPAGFRASDLTARVPQILSGQTVTLTWIASAHADCALSYSDGGPPVDVSHVRTWTSPPLYATTVFLLHASATEGGQTVGLDLTTSVIVASPDVVSFDATPDELDADQSVVISWRSVHADGVYLRIGESSRESLPPVSDPEKPKSITPQYGTAYTLQAFKKLDGTPQLSRLFPLGLTFNALDITTFTADPPTVDVQHPSTRLTWKVAHAKSVTYEGTTVPATGGHDEHPTKDTTYTLTATWVDGSVTRKTFPVAVRQIAFRSATISMSAERTGGSPASVSAIVVLHFTVENASAGKATVNMHFIPSYGGWGPTETLSGDATKVSDNLWEVRLPIAIADKFLHRPIASAVSWSFRGLQEASGTTQLTCAPPFA